MNVNVNVGVRVTVSARVSVSVNVCRGSFKCAWFRADSHRSVEVDAGELGGPRAGAERCVGVFGITPLVGGFACAGQQKRAFDRGVGSAAESTLSGLGCP